MISKIKNSIFFKSTIVLLLGGILGKTVGFFIKIIITRELKTQGMGLYSLLSPTIGMLTTISTFSYPTAISTLISKNKYDSKSLIFSALIMSFIINIFIMAIVILLAPFITSNLLKESSLLLPLICVSFTLPFISVSSIIKGYFWGKQNMYPYMLSNFLEQVTRIILISLFINKIIKYGAIYAISFILIVNICGEVISQLVMLKFKPKEKIKLKNLKFNLKYIKDLYRISIPATSSKIIGSIAYFLEPVVLTNMLLFMGYTKDYIINEYGILNAYSMSLLLMPQFFTQNMSTALVPELSKQYTKKDYKMCKKRIKQIVGISCLIGVICTLIILLFPKFFLNLIYKTTEGVDYIKLLAPFTILFYIEYPLINALQSLNKAKKAMYATIIGAIIRLSSIIIFSLLGFGMYSLVISIILNIISSTIIYYKLINKILTV